MKIFLAILGCAAFVLGVVGIFVPLLPTTPFLLLAAALWVRSSPRLYENRAIPLRAKVVSIALMWGTMLYCIFGLLDGRWWAQVGLLAVAVGVTWHILSFATLRK